MEAKFINPVLTSMITVISTMAQIQPKPGKPVLKTDDVARGVVTGIIAMQGERARGSLAISFPKAVILDLARRILSEERSDVDEVTCDLTGEITNMVMGGAKAIFAEAGYDFGMEQPDVLSGPDHLVEHSVLGPKILLPFLTESGEFYVEICFEQ